jgi:hypothetical protein
MAVVGTVFVRVEKIFPKKSLERDAARGEVSTGQAGDADPEGCAPPESSSLS